MFFHFYKNSKTTRIKTLNYSIHSSKKHRQYESNKVNNTATKHSLCSGNGVGAYMSNSNKATSHTVLYVNHKNRTLRAQKHKTFI